MIWLLSAAVAAPAPCPALAGVALQGTPGQRKLALVVGVGDYAAKVGGKDIDLPGPPHDAARVADVLTRRYAFPAANVCVLTDAAATRAAFDRAWTEHLGRAQSGDAVVFYFSGHGSQRADVDGQADEEDRYDETLVLHDSRVTGKEVTDDQLNALLTAVSAKTQNVTVIIDACNSGSGTRGVPIAQSGLISRWIDPEDAPVTPSQVNKPAVVGDYQPRRLPSVVYVGAALDGTAAYERDGSGVFTDALLDALESGDATWSRLSYLLPHRVSMAARQTPTFSGPLERTVFGTAATRIGGLWTVSNRAEGVITFRGPSMPGWGPGALVEVRDPKLGAVKAQVRVREMQVLTAVGDVVGQPTAPIGPGDYAELVSPSPQTTAIRVQFEPGVPGAAAIRAAIHADEVLESMVVEVPVSANFVLRAAADGAVEVVDAFGETRNHLASKTPEDAQVIARTLGLHARQAAILALTSAPSPAYPTPILRVGLRTATAQEVEGAKPLTSVPFAGTKGGASRVTVPMCTAITAEVRADGAPSAPLNLAVLYLQSNGTVWVIDQDRSFAAAGQTAAMPLGWVAPPLGLPDRIVVVGTHEDMDWRPLESVAPPDFVGQRSAIRGSATTLQGLVAAYTAPTRSAVVAPPRSADVAFTAALLEVTVEDGEGAWTVEQRLDPEACERAQGKIP